MPKSKGKDTRYFTKTVNGEVVTQAAHTPADTVRFTYDGWRDVTADVEAAQAAVKQIGDAAPAKPAEPAVRK
jgi:hypothetical protein